MTIIRFTLGVKVCWHGLSRFSARLLLPDSRKSLI